MGVEFIGDPNKPQYAEGDEIEFEDDEQLFFFDPDEPDYLVNNLDIDDDNDSDYDPDEEFGDFMTESECDYETENVYETDEFSGDATEEDSSEGETKATVVVSSEPPIGRSLERSGADSQSEFETGGESANT